MDWINCAERLPKPGVDVLVLSKRRGRRSVLVLHLLEDQDRGWYPGGWGIEYTSHWMPIPELPKEPTNDRA